MIQKNYVMIRYLQWYLVVFLLLTGLSVTAQQKTQMTGTVLSEYGEPLAGVNIFMNEIGKKVTKVSLTNKNGIFTFTNLKAGGKYDISASFIGYDTYIFKDFQVNEGNPNSLSVQLKMVSKQLENVVVVGYGAFLISIITISFLWTVTI